MHPSAMKYAKIGSAIRPIYRSISTRGNKRKPTWSISIEMQAIIFNLLLDIITSPKRIRIG